MSEWSGVALDLLRRSARVRDEDLMPLVGTPAANALFDEIVSTPAGGETPTLPEMESWLADEGRKRSRAGDGHGRHRVRRIAVAAAFASAIIVSVPAFGVVQHIKSWLADGRGPDHPVPTAPDVVIASGVAGVPWKIVATQTNQGLCLFIVFEADADESGTGGCGWGTDLYGYPSATPHGYGSGGDRLHWIEGSNGSGGNAALNRRIVEGVAGGKVARVDLVLADGRTIRASVVERPDGIDAPLNFWWAVLPAEVAGVDLTSNVELPGSSDDLAPVHELVARDSTGAVLERRVVDLPNG